jgi:hypothetical protein
VNTSAIACSENLEVRGLGKALEWCIRNFMCLQRFYSSKMLLCHLCDFGCSLFPLLCYLGSCPSFALQLCKTTSPNANTAWHFWRCHVKASQPMQEWLRSINVALVAADELVHETLPTSRNGPAKTPAPLMPIALHAIHPRFFYIRLHRR